VQLVAEVLGRVGEVGLLGDQPVLEWVELS